LKPARRKGGHFIKTITPMHFSLKLLICTGLVALLSACYTVVVTPIAPMDYAVRFTPYDWTVVNSQNSQRSKGP
jgi:hypothetical protein